MRKYRSYERQEASYRQKAKYNGFLSEISSQTISVLPQVKIADCPEHDECPSLSLSLTFPVTSQDLLSMSKAQMVTPEPSSYLGLTLAYPKAFQKVCGKWDCTISSLKKKLWNPGIVLFSYNHLGVFGDYLYNGISRLFWHQNTLIFKFCFSMNAFSCYLRDRERVPIAGLLPECLQPTTLAIIYYMPWSALTGSCYQSLKPSIKPGSSSIWCKCLSPQVECPSLHELCEVFLQLLLSLKSTEVL